MRPYGCTTYTHDSSNTFWKIGPRGKNSIFVDYSKTFKRYVFIGEPDSVSVTKFESRETTFLQSNIQKNGDICSKQSIYAMHDQVELTLVHSSGIDDTTDGEANVPDSTPYDFVDTERIADLVSNVSDCGHAPSVSVLLRHRLR